MLTVTQKKLLKTLTKLTLLLVFIELWAQILYSLNAISEFSTVVTFSKQVLQSWVIIGGLLYFFLVQVAIYVIFTVFIWGLAIFDGKFLKLNDKNIIRFGILLWIVAVIDIFAMNQLWYPWSAFAFLPQNSISLIATTTVITICSVLLLAAKVIAAIQVIVILWRYNKYICSMFLLLCMLLITMLLIALHKHPLLEPEYSGVPNIIIIGLDSVRPDLTSIANSSHPVTPNIDKFIKGSVRFTEAFTPLARTFPSWMSILTGNDPRINGARYSLPDLKALNYSQTLAHILKHEGYVTIYASDDRRFNHITKAFGFDQMIVPKTGFNDFILGTFNDFPFSNLLINNRFGKLLFPYNYNNRSAAVTYEPKTFITYFSRSIATNYHRPIFLGIHLTLPHWPFFWREAPSLETKREAMHGINQKLYIASIKRLDEQFGALVKALQKNQLLDNSLVFIMSDHGQGLGLPNERVTSIKGYQAGTKQLSAKTFKLLTEPTYGHGTDILNMAQEHIVFAVKQFGHYKSFAPRKVTYPVSLIDIKPTSLAYLNIKHNHSQGISLLPLLTGKKNTLAPRDLFIESGFTLPGLLVAQPNVKKLLQEGLSYFAIDPDSGAVVIRHDLGQLIIQGKQRAVIRYPWLVAVYPTKHRQHVIIVANMQTRQWTTDLNSPLAVAANAKSLLTSLKQFYGNELQDNVAH